MGEIKEAGREHLEELVALLHQLSPPERGEVADPGRLERAFAEISRQRHHYLYIYLHEGEIASTASLLIQPNLTHKARPYGHLENVVTRRDFRGYGFGGELVRYLTGIAREKGCYKVILNCEEKNVAFYRKHGYRKTDEGEMRVGF